jgi:D-3-phosphoglycerate dehydrogenase
VGSILGKEGVNINFMTVAPVSKAFDAGTQKSDDTPALKNEALMILGVDKPVDDTVANTLMQEDGVLSVSLVSL